MNRLLYLIVPILLSCLICWAAPIQKDISKDILKQLPAGWKIEQIESGYIVTRTVKVEFYNAVSMRNGTDQEIIKERLPYAQKGYYKILILITPYLDKNVYGKIQSTIVKPRYECKPEIYGQEWYGFSFTGLPDLYGPDYSVYLSSSVSSYNRIWPHSTNKECESILKKIIELFAKY